MTILLLGLFPFWGDTDSSRPPAPKPSLLGTWTLLAVQHVVQPPDGAPAYCWDAHITFGARFSTLTRRGEWLDDTGDTSYYTHFGDSLNVTDASQCYRGRILDLSATRLVVETRADRPEGQYVITTTYLRGRFPVHYGQPFPFRCGNE